MTDGHRTDGHRTDGHRTDGHRTDKVTYRDTSYHSAQKSRQQNFLNWSPFFCLTSLSTMDLNTIFSSFQFSLSVRDFCGHNVSLKFLYQKFFCQPQPQLQLQLRLRLASYPFDSATHPPTVTPAKGFKLNLENNKPYLLWGSEDPLAKIIIMLYFA